jgi:membrane-bound serine protease (ClpP class)
MAPALPGLSLAAAALAGQPAGDSVAQPAVPAYRQANKVAVLTVHGTIDYVTRRSLERRVERALRDGADAIVLDINTPGGELGATLDICHLLKTDAPANTVAWINPKAYSAGTIIALAAREIVVHPNASFGDAAPIQAPLGAIMQMAPTERAKIEAPILEEVVNSAQRNHYDEKLVQAFVSVGVELWLIEHKETGEKIFVDRSEYRLVFDDEPPAQLTGVTPWAGASDESQRGIRPWVDKLIPVRDVDPQADATEQEFVQQLPTARPPLTDADRGSYRLVRQVISSDRLLTLRANEAIYYGLGVTAIANDAELLAYFGGTGLVRYDQWWSESLARFLMHPVVVVVLIVIFLVALFLEIAAPGVGMFGTVSIAALLLLLGAPAMIGLAQWWGILLVIVGLLLIAVELFVLPGFGVAGVTGLLALLVGLVGAFVTADLGTAQGQEQLFASLTRTIIGLLLAGTAIWIIARHLKTWPLLDRLILKTEVGAPALRAGGPSDSKPEMPGTLMHAMGLAQAHGLAAGDLGTAYTSLRPAGRGEFDGRIVDVQSLGGYIERGTPIRILSVGRYVVDVEEADE